MTDKVVRHGWHWSFGWLRRPELDQDNFFAYEMPDGDIVLTRREECKREMYIDGRLDENSGEVYPCISIYPRRAISKNRKWTLSK